MICIDFLQIFFSCQYENSASHIRVCYVTSSGRQRPKKYEDLSAGLPEKLQKLNIVVDKMDQKI